jgi:hypothetical protein
MSIEQRSIDWPLSNEAGLLVSILYTGDPKRSANGVPNTVKKNSAK